MPTKSIIDTLLAAAAFLEKTTREIASQALKDAYQATKAYLQKKLRANPDAVDAFNLATDKPDSPARKALLIEECDSVELAGDAELAHLICQLAELLPQAAETITQRVCVTGRDNRVQVAGRDLITTEKIIARNAITPDGRHLSTEERDQVRRVIGELAIRLAGAGGSPNFAGAHRMLQKRFKVASYLLLPREQFEEALAFLKQQRAIHRSSLQKRDPIAYRNDLFRSIFAGARELTWDGNRVYQLAAKVLGLSRPVESLKELGPVQLKALAEAVRQQVRKMRQTATS